MGKRAVILTLAAAVGVYAAYQYGIFERAPRHWKELHEVAYVEGQCKDEE